MLIFQNEITGRVILEEFIIYPNEWTNIEATKDHWVKKTSPSKNPPRDLKYL